MGTLVQLAIDRKKVDISLSHIKLFKYSNAALQDGIDMPLIKLQQPTLKSGRTEKVSTRPLDNVTATGWRQPVYISWHTP